MAVTSSLDLTSDPCAVVGTRVFGAPRELVWSLWADPKHPAKLSA